MSHFTSRRAQAWLGTFVDVEAGAGDQTTADKAVAAAFDVIGEVHRAMSFHSNDSDLARLHAEAHKAPVSVSHHTWRVVLHALAVAAASEGAFDPTIAPRLVSCGALPAPAGPIPSAEASWADIQLFDDKRIAFRRTLWLDLGGIAKGYAVDLAIRVLRECGATHGCVNAGGDLRVFGMETRHFPLSIRSPASPHESIVLGTLANGAVASSGDYFPRDATNRMSPIVSPRQGLRPAGHASVTVLAPECWIADALTKVVSLQGSASTPILKAFGASAAIIDANGTLRAMPGFMEHFGPMPSSGAQLHA